MFFTFSTSKIILRTNSGKRTKGASIGFEIAPTEDRQILEIGEKFVLTSDGLYGLYYKTDEWHRVKPTLNIYIDEGADAPRENFSVGTVLFTEEYDGDMEYFPATLNFNVGVSKEDFHRIENHAICGLPSISLSIEASDQSGEILEYGGEPVDADRKLTIKPG